MLEPVESIQQLRAAVSTAREDGRRIGFVPTMGALHEGHTRLIEQCRAQAGLVVVSIFVNPTQFGPNEDLTSYPRTLQEDLVKCAAAGADVVFVPTDAVIYPRGRLATFVEVPGLAHVLEGASRPDHFRGVATVVLALFEIVRPDLAVFGQKDYQQQLVIRRMIEDLHVPVELVVVPTVRERDGLAMSSRNRYLDPAPAQGGLRALSSALAGRESVAAGQRDANRVRQLLDTTISLERLVQLDYAEVADGDSLESLVLIEPERRAMALVAARVGSTRLIDNLLLTE